MVFNTSLLTVTIVKILTEKRGGPRDAAHRWSYVEIVNLGQDLISRAYSISTNREREACEENEESVTKNTTYYNAAPKRGLRISSSTYTQLKGYRFGK